MAQRTVVREGPRTPLPTEPRPQAREARSRLATAAAAGAILVATLAFGLVGLLAMAPPLRRRRRRRAAACGVCRRNQRLWLTVSALLAIVTLAGGGLRLTQDQPTAPRCPVTLVSNDDPSPAVGDPHDAAVPAFLREALDTPASGLAVAYVEWQGRDMCAMQHPAITLAFAPGGRSLKGSTIGNVFVTPRRPDLDDEQTEALARHESRHSDQWAVATALGGITLMPLAYFVDGSLYPDELNHFEQSAGLEAGGYPPAPVPRPGPQTWALAGWSLLVAYLLRGRLRQAFRAVTGRQRAPALERCARHTPGW